MRRLLVLAVLAAAVSSPSTAGASTDHSFWPRIDGLLLMNKLDSSRPLDGRPGMDPFAGQDPQYLCDELHTFRDGCKGLNPSTPRHNKLLGGHGDDTITAGPLGDVLWGDFKPKGQPTSQHDLILGGDGRDYIYASHGFSEIHAGAGNDYVKVHFGRGVVDCGPGGNDTVYVSHKNRKRLRITGCEHISYKSLGY